MQYAVISAENGTLGTFKTLEEAEAAAFAHCIADQENEYPTIYMSTFIDGVQDRPARMLRRSPSSLRDNR